MSDKSDDKNIKPNRRAARKELTSVTKIVFTQAVNLGLKKSPKNYNL